MISIAGIDHIVLRCADLARMERFYCNVLGMSVAKRNEPMGLVHLRAGASLFDLIAVDGVLGRMGGAGPGPEGRNVDHICLAVRDFDPNRVVACLKAHGIKPGAHATRFGAGGDGLSVYLADPEGNQLELRGR
jgi:glyoxylase I family protein